MTILSLLSQGISYPKAAKVTPCKCTMLSYWGLQAFITAVFFIRDMQQVSCDCIGYHHTFIPQHHPAPALLRACHTIIIQCQLHCACCFKPMTKGHQPDLQVVPHDKRLLVPALAILA
jgi:hypothetical protein